MGFGARVYTCSRDRDGLDECLRGWRDSGFEVGGSVCDVSKRSQRLELIDSVASLFDGKLNILVSLYPFHHLILELYLMKLEISVGLAVSKNLE